MEWFCLNIQSAEVADGKAFAAKAARKTWLSMPWARVVSTTSGAFDGRGTPVAAAKCL